MSRWFVIVALWVLAVCAFAHDLNLTGVRVVEQQDHRSVTVTTPLSVLLKQEKLTSAGPKEIQSALLGRLTRCFSQPVSQPHLILDEANDMAMLQVTAPATGELKMTNRLYPEIAESKTLFVVLRDGVTVTNTVVSGGSSSGGAWPVAWQYGRMGVEHIATGFDHLCFVLGLMLAGKNLKGLLKAVTLFTVAHSVTLSLAALGFVHVSPRVVEPMIALSIIVVAGEAVAGGKGDLRPYLAAAFGLVHGLGFAGALAESGLPSGSVPLALGTFNLGVELGQVAFLLALWPALQFARAKAPRVVDFLPWMVGAAGCYWLGERLLHR